MGEILGGKERLLSVESNPQVELSALKVDIARKHLFSVINAQSYEEVMAEDSQKTVAAIQILLSGVGYDVGRIDGFLVTKGQKTSKTMEAIKKFQRARGITPIDGLPGPTVINELYQYSLDYERDVYKFISKDSLTVGEISQVVMYWNKHNATALKFRNLKSMTDDHAKELRKLKCRRLEAPSLKTLSNNQAECLKNFIYLDLDGLTRITDIQAECLSNVSYLKLRGLKSINDKQARALAKVERLFIDEHILTPSQKKLLKNRL